VSRYGGQSQFLLTNAETQKIEVFRAAPFSFFWTSTRNRPELNSRIAIASAEFDFFFNIDQLAE